MNEKVFTYLNFSIVKFKIWKILFINNITHKAIKKVME